jgi:hypothetical protein
MLSVQLLAFILSKLDRDSLGLLSESLDYQEEGLMRLACSSGNSELVSILLRAGVVPDKECFSEAVAYDRRGIVALLLGSGQVDPSEDGNYALKIVAKRCDVTTCMLLLRDDRVDPNVLEGEDLCTEVQDLILTVLQNRAMRSRLMIGADY